MAVYTACRPAGVDLCRDTVAGMLWQGYPGRDTLAGILWQGYFYRDTLTEELWKTRML